MLPAGTRIYVKKLVPVVLNIQPDKTLINDNLYVAYDVRISGVTVIPQGTRVMGDWVTESCPVIAAQLQIHRIFLSGIGQEFNADSDVINDVTLYNNSDIDCVGYLRKIKQYRQPSGVTRRVVKYNCRTKTLPDNNLNCIYLDICTKEIPVTLTKDFYFDVPQVLAKIQPDPTYKKIREPIPYTTPKQAPQGILPVPVPVTKVVVQQVPVEVPVAVQPPCQPCQIPCQPCQIPCQPCQMPVQNFSPYQIPGQYPPIQTAYQAPYQTMYQAPYQTAYQAPYQAAGQFPDQYREYPESV